MTLSLECRGEGDDVVRARVVGRVEDRLNRERGLPYFGRVGDGKPSMICGKGSLRVTSAFLLSDSMTP